MSSREKQARKNRSRALDSLATARHYRAIDMHKQAVYFLGQAAFWRKRYIDWCGYEF